MKEGENSEQWFGQADFAHALQGELIGHAGHEVYYSFHRTRIFCIMHGAVPVFEVSINLFQPQLRPFQSFPIVIKLHQIVKDNSEDAMAVFPVLQETLVIVDTPQAEPEQLPHKVILLIGKGYAFVRRRV